MEEQNKYWENHKNDNCFNLPRRGIRSRLDLFREGLFNKKVLHIGCTDWPDTEEKLKNKNLLHQFLGNITPNLFGIDVDKEGIDTMQKNGIKNIFIGDIYNLYNDKNLLDEKFDILLISEVIEHLINPGLALESVKKYILKTNPKCKVVFTVPNYHNLWRNLTLGFKNKEVVHSDHKFYFSYRTFRTLLEYVGFKIDDFYFIIYSSYPSTVKGRLLLKLLSKTSPSLAPYLFFECYI